MEAHYVDTYTTAEKPSTVVLYKEQKSRFYGYVFPICQESEVKPILENLKGQHPGANHVCYAWKLGVAQPTYRVNDDGEPSNSAGAPIYGQIQAFKVTQILVVVVRLFGGIKLGVGGLMGAYKTTAQMALESCTLVVKALESQIDVRCKYSEIHTVMRIVKQQHLEIISQDMGINCQLVLTVRKSKVENIMNQLAQVPGVQLTLLGLV